MIYDIKKVKKIFLNNNISNFFFYIALSIEVLLVLIDKSDYVNPFEGRMFQITFCLFLVKILLTEYTKREYALFAFLFILGLLIDYYGDRNEVIRFTTAVFSCKGIDLKRGLKIVFWIQSLGIVLISLLSLFGIYGRLTVEKEYQGEGVFTRYCFGMGNANSFHTMIFSSVLLGLFLYYEILRWRWCLLLMILNCGLYFLTDCRTATILVAITIFFFSLLPWLKKKKNELLKILIKCGMLFDLLLLLLSVYFAAGASRYCRYYWDSFWENPPNPPYVIIFFDKLLTGRILSLTEYGYDGTMGSWSWFTVPDHNVYFDLGWIRMFYWYGIIPTIIFILLLAYIMIWLYKNQKFDAVLLFLLVFLHMFVEAHFVSVYIGRAYYLLIIGAFFSQIISKKSKE